MGLADAATAYNGMGCSCGSAITAEMNDWVKLGGGNSGCCGNAAHTYGYHCPANRVPSSDYSRRRDPGGINAVVNWDWACAGDFGHNGNPRLRAMHATVLSGLVAGKWPMICEFIGQPWSGKPVYYWARWEGVSNLRRYTGSGHDTWSHISWYRSRANQRAYLWTPGSTPTPESTKKAPAFPGYTMTFNADKVDANVRTWQGRMAERGWTIDVDGIFGPGTLRVVRAFQEEKRLGTDGEIGPITWQAAWTLPVS